VLLKAGVAVVSPDYDPNVPYSAEILITKPERIGSYDETKMELDCTRGGKDKKDRTLKAPDDDGTTIVTKSDKCASACCC
jgi:hypothetical protein